jgi:hypothetical protein
MSEQDVVHAIDIGVDSFRASLLSSRMNIHPAMIHKNQPNADGRGIWSVGAICAELRNLGVSDAEFLAAFGLESFADWCAPDLSVSAVPSERMVAISEWMSSRGWKAPWTMESLARACRARGASEADVAAACGVSWIGEWESDIPQMHWEAISSALGIGRDGHGVMTEG